MRPLALRNKPNLFKKNMFRYITIAVLIAAATSEVIFEGPCPDVKPIENFEFEAVSILFKDIFLFNLIMRLFFLITLNFPSILNFMITRKKRFYKKKIISTILK